MNSFGYQKEEDKERYLFPMWVRICLRLFVVMHFFRLLLLNYTTFF